MNVMMELRKCCNHPFLIRGAEEKLLLEATQQIRANDSAAELNHVKIFQDQLVKSSGKMVLIHKVSFATYLSVVCQQNRIYHI